MTPGLFLELKRFDSSVVIFLVAERRATKEILPQPQRSPKTPANEYHLKTGQRE
jgi:hypothetical protein